jgi:hypothetical protein
MNLSNFAVAAALGLTIFGAQARAEGADSGIVIDITQVGDNVVATYSGSVDLSGLTLLGTAAPGGGIIPDLALVIFGAGGDVDEYGGLSGPKSFGTGGTTYVSSQSGDSFGLDGGADPSTGLLYVPEGYTSGTLLSGSATYDNQTFASLGLKPGNYVYTWDSDPVTVNVGIPEPSTWALMLLGFAGLGFAGYRSRTAASIAA